MKFKRFLSKSVIPVASILAIIAVLSLLTGFYDLSSAPDSDDDEFLLILDDEQISVSDEGVPVASDDVDDPPSPPNHPPVIFEYAVRQLTPADISRGNLILINHEHGFEIPDAGRLFSIAGINVDFFRVTGDELLLLEEVIHPLFNMMNAFYLATGNDSVSVISGFRDLERQREILDDHIERMGSVEARRWVSEPGHSEHHSGLAIDFGVYQDGVLRTFLGTGTTAWFSQYAHNFGFILRYPEGKTEITGIAHEPWHFRYVGLPHSYFIHRNGWVLEQYIDVIMQYTTRENPFTAYHRGYVYEIYFTREMEVRVPFGSIFDVSGTNIDGFIVTVNTHHPVVFDGVVR